MERNGGRDVTHPCCSSIEAEQRRYGYSDKRSRERVMRGVGGTGPCKTSPWVHVFGGGTVSTGYRDDVSTQRQSLWTYAGHGVEIYPNMFGIACQSLRQNLNL